MAAKHSRQAGPQASREAVCLTSIDLVQPQRLSVAWDASFANALELAEACDVPVRWSCRMRLAQSR